MALFVAELNPCLPNPCENDGVCQKKSSTAFTCQCAPGWTGDFCHTGKYRFKVNDLLVSLTVLQLRNIGICWRFALNTGIAALTFHYDDVMHVSQTLLSKNQIQEYLRCASFSSELQDTLTTCSTLA